ncbi:MAG: hypothetical protein E7585_02980 [Ruminococcaceae bacterium]|nr:hypothetical protein [Oscillospiraceae bacterium]
MTDQVNVREAITALTEKPMLATSAERLLILNEIKSKGKELPHPLRFSAMLSKLLSRVSVPLEPYDLIAGRCVDRLLTAEEEQIFQEFRAHPDNPRQSRTFPSCGHCSYDWENLISRGLPGLREAALASLAEKTDEEERIFLRGVLEIYDAIRDFMLRYADAADEKGMTRVAKNLRKAATERPDDFYSGLQLLWTVAFINCAYITLNPTLTLGRMDQLLYPLYAADLAAGRLTREEAGALITDYYCKHNLIMGRGEHQVGDAKNSTTFDRICNFDAPQYLLLGGTVRGEDAVNDLTYLLVERIVPAFKNPVMVVRYYPGMDQKHPRLWEMLVGRSLASASLMYYNDDNMKRTFRRIGLPEEAIEDYVHVGCNWPGLGTMGSWMAIGPSAARYECFCSDEEKKAICVPYMRYRHKGGWPMVLMEVMRELADRPKLTVEDLYEGFFAKWSDYVERKLRQLERELEVRRRRPAAVLTYNDCFSAHSVRTASCHSAGAKYHYEFQSFYMFGSTVDCMIVADQLIFLQKKLTLRQLLDAADANFEGYPEVLALCRGVEKYGSDTPHSNSHAKRMAEGTMGIVIEKSRPYLEKYGLFLEPCLQSDTWHLKAGQAAGATVDGRLAGTPYSQNSRPANGSCINGTTAMLNAMLHLPPDGILSGALNLDVDPRQFAGEAGHRLFGTVLATYFNNGGLHAQVSAVGAKDLMDAQQNPDRHRDLRVRVTGYSGIFVDICKDLQDDIIERFK